MSLYAQTLSKFDCDIWGLKFIFRRLLAGIEQSSNGGEDLMTLEAEISELQRENARVESQMIKLKSDINAMENHLGHSEKVSYFNFL